MNVKLHTPKSLQAGSGLSSTKQFLLSLIATTVSIVLTFGTAAVIDSHKKESAKREMVKMVIYDFDKTIAQIQDIDTALSRASRIQQELAVHPEWFDSLRYELLRPLLIIESDFPEITERVFSTNIETFSTIGDVNFVNEVANFYICRRRYKETVLDSIQHDFANKQIMQSLKNVFSVSFPEYCYLNWAFLDDLKDSREKCMKMMRLTEADMESFSRKLVDERDRSERDSMELVRSQEQLKAMELIRQAQEKLSQ
ncbi:MAG: hypothetical protein IKR25_01620 [Muribaculaceae bacterium]|nr:hypothetical protein [Muribaculaceae bacterium]